MKYITSRHNPEIKNIVALHTRKGRRTAHAFLAEGIRTCLTLLNSYKLIACYVTESMQKDILEHIPEHTCTIVSDEVMHKISQAQTPSGIVCVFELPKNQTLTSLDSSVILYEMTDPGNVGTLIRTAAALGIAQVICVGGVDAWNHKTIQASAGTIGNVAVIETTWNDILQIKGSASITALVVSDGVSPERLTFPTTFIIGSEAHGIPQNVIDACDQLCTLSMPGGTESLNAAIAGSIALYTARSFPR